MTATDNLHNHRFGVGLIGDSKAIRAACTALDAHAGLLAAAKLLAHQYEQICEDNNVMGWPAMLEQTRAAIAKAEQEQTP